MADRYDRGERERNGGGFVIGVFAGAVVGAGLGLIFAPTSGSKLRRQLGERCGSLANTASDTYQRAADTAADLAGKAEAAAGEWADKASDAADDLAHRGKDLYGKARKAVAKGADKA